MVESSPSVFKRGWEMLWEEPGAYSVVAILPTLVIIAVTILVGRLIVHFYLPTGEHWDALTLWASMGWGARLLAILATTAWAAVPEYVVARGVCRLAWEQQMNGSISFGPALLDMLRFLPTALLYFLVLGIPTAMGSAFFVVPGVLIACQCALIIPAGIAEHLGPLAAIRRGFSLVRRVFDRVLGIYACYIAFVILGRVVLSMVTAGDEAPNFGFFVLFGFWFLALLWAQAPVNIMFTLLYYRANEMNAAPLAAEAGAGPNSSEEGS